MRGLIIDCFAGGGGASVGIVQGGRQRDRSTKTSPQRNPLEDEDRTRADSDKLAGTSVKECGRAVPA